MESCSPAALPDPSWAPAGADLHTCSALVIEPAESLIFGWKQCARDPIGEEQHHVYIDVHRADPESGTLGPVLTSSMSRDLLHSSAYPGCQ